MRGNGECILSVDKTSLPTIYSTPSFHAYNIYLHSSYKMGTYHSKEIEVDQCELCKQGTAYSQPRACGFPSLGGQYINKRDTLANITRIAGQDISQAINRCWRQLCRASSGMQNDTRICVVVLVAMFSNLVKKRHQRYPASTKDLEAIFVEDRRNTRRNALRWRAEVCSNILITRPVLTALSQPNQTAVQAATSDHIHLHMRPASMQRHEVPGDTLDA